ncbi:MAG: STAS domain-containing protein [Acidobacteriaceae bacterium]|nr:STAS domain-containing protein [Acidobacteriaceae bacterium]MBV8571848.1 STAS domain-containing protein [Acidobacteriaceae bacterium]
MDNQTASEVRVHTEPGSRDGITVMKVSGPLTIRNFFEFQDKTRQNTSPVLIIDLADVPYMDSAALGSLLGVHVSCGKHKRKYGLINVTERLLTMFTVCGVRDVLVTFPSLADAEAALL